MDVNLIYSVLLKSNPLPEAKSVHGADNCGLYMDLPADGNKRTNMYTDCTDTLWGQFTIFVCDGSNAISSLQMVLGLNMTII